MIDKKVILFNGPPRSGKDTATVALLDFYQKTKHLKFSRPLKEGLEKFFNIKDPQDVESKKDQKLPELLGLTWREAQISLSEEWAKVKFGKSVFGKIILNDILYSNKELFFISDSGFYEEAEPIIKVIGEKNCLLIRLKRNNCSFDNDSRSYWKNPYKDLMEVTIDNNKSVTDLLYKCTQEIDKWMDIR